MVFIFVSNLSAFFIHAPPGKMAESGVLMGANEKLNK